MNDKMLPALSVNKGCSSHQSPAAPMVSLEGTQGKNRLPAIKPSATAAIPTPQKWCALRGIPGEGNGIPLQCYCQENPIDGGAL